MTTGLPKPLKCTKPARESKWTFQPVRSAGRKIFKEAQVQSFAMNSISPAPLCTWSSHPSPSGISIALTSCPPVKQLPHLLQWFLIIILSINAFPRNSGNCLPSVHAAPAVFQQATASCQVQPQFCINTPCNTV